MELNRRSLTGLALGVGAFLGARAAVRWARAYDLRNKVVLITGGSRGLGLVLAREFGRHGARLALCARAPDEVDRALDELGSRGVPASGVVCDITDRRQVQQMVEAFRSHFGRID